MYLKLKGLVISIILSKILKNFTLPGTSLRLEQSTSISIAGSGLLGSLTELVQIVWVVSLMLLSFN